MFNQSHLGDCVVVGERETADCIKTMCPWSQGDSKQTRWLPRKQADLSLDLQHPCESPMWRLFLKPQPWRKRQADPWSSLATQSS